MSLEHAILGFLNYGPYSGYDLKKMFDVSVQHFWPADQSQIYRTLSRLEDRGWVDMDVIEQDDRPDRKEYRITEAGQAELRQWLTTPLRPKEMRHAGLVQIFFAGQLKDEEILEMLERVAERLRKLVAGYAQVPQESVKYAELIGSPREEFFWMLTLDWGVHAARAQLEWLEDVIQKIKNKEHPAS